MREWLRWLRIVAVCTVLVCAFAPAQAEVAHESEEEDDGSDTRETIGTLIMGVITDDPDPISNVWTPVREDETLIFRRLKPSRRRQRPTGACGDSVSGTPCRGRLARLMLAKTD